jgi:hypothetical protein
MFHPYFGGKGAGPASLNWHVYLDPSPYYSFAMERGYEDDDDEHGILFSFYPLIFALVHVHHDEGLLFCANTFRSNHPTPTQQGQPT